MRRRQVAVAPRNAPLIAAALLLVLVLGSGSPAVDPLLRGGQGHAAPNEDEAEVLVEVPLPREVIPDPFDIHLQRIRMAPGQEAVVTAGRWGDARGAWVACVLAGRLALRVEAPIRVKPSDGTAFADVPAGTQVVLTAGDAAVFPFEAARSYASADAAPADFLQGGIATADWFPPGLPAGLPVLTDGGVTRLPTSAVPVGSVVLRLERRVIGVGTPFPPSSVQGPEGIQVSLFEPPGPATPTLIGQPRTVYVLTLGP